MHWDNLTQNVKISVTKLNDIEYKLSISNKNHDTWQTIINSYYWTSDTVNLDDLEILLMTGLKNEICDNLKCSTVICVNEPILNVTLSFVICSKYIKQKIPDIKFSLDQVSFDEIIKHKFIIQDVINEINPVIDNDYVIRCKLVYEWNYIAYAHNYRLINCANDEIIMIVNFIVSTIASNNNTGNIYTNMNFEIEKVDKNDFISALQKYFAKYNKTTDFTKYSFYSESNNKEYSETCILFHESNQNDKFNRILNLIGSYYKIQNIETNIGKKVIGSHIDEMDMILTKFYTTKYPIEIKNVNDKILGKYKIINIAYHTTFMIIENHN